MRSRVCALALATLLLCTGWVVAGPTAYTGVVTVDTVTARPGDHFSVPVRLKDNNAPLVVMLILLKINYPGLTFDSVSFMGTILPSNFNGDCGYDSETGIMRIKYLAEFRQPWPTLQTSSGILCHLFLSLTSSSQQGAAEIDSVYTDTYEAGINKQEFIVFADSSGTMEGTFRPSFVPGAVIISAPTGVDDNTGSLPIAFELAQNYPNPFNPTTIINYSLPTASHVKLEVFNVLGQRVAMLEDGQKQAGSHATEFDAGGFPSGIYFYRLTYNGGVATKKMVLLK